MQQESWLTLYAGLKFDNIYAWVVKFDEKGILVQVCAYLDSTFLQQAAEENERPSHRAPITELAHQAVSPVATLPLKAQESERGSEVSISELSL